MPSLYLGHWLMIGLAVIKTALLFSHRFSGSAIQPLATLSSRAALDSHLGSEYYASWAVLISYRHTDRNHPCREVFHL